MKNIKSIIFNSESFKFDDSNYVKNNESNMLNNASLIFNPGAYIIFRSSQEKGVAPSNTEYFNISLVEKDITIGANESSLAKLEMQYTSDDSTVAQIMAYYPNKNNPNFAFIRVKANADGTCSTYVPPPNNDSNDGNIATTKWVRDLLVRNGYTLNS